jgi:two-component system, NtrC family, nitrogen regulation sensor histidine kinase NtrY
LINKTIYYNISIRVIGIALTSLVACILFFSLHQWIYLALGGLFLLWQTISTIYWLNRTNRQIAFFFEAIRNEDSTLHFPLKTGNKATDKLNTSMNRLNDLIGLVKMQNRIQEQYFETIIEQAATGLITYNESGHVLLSNSATRRLLGLEPLTHINQLEKVEKGLGKVFRELEPGQQKLVNITNERGSMQLSLHATSMSIKNSNVTLVSIQDIRNELDEKETESWIRLIRVLTHEIMNSIAPITSLSETISGYYESGDGKRNIREIDDETISNTIKGLKVIRERGSGLVKFVESYRKLTHLHDPICKTVGLQLFLEKVKMLLCAELNLSDSNLSIQVRVPEMNVFVDENLFSQVIINLVRNSWEALQNQEDKRIQIIAVDLGNNHTRIEVIDNGPGIHPELLDKIFVPFFTTRENGSGIGLSLSQQIIRLHGGKLAVKSQPGNTCFEIIL